MPAESPQKSDPCVLDLTKLGLPPGTVEKAGEHDTLTAKPDENAPTDERPVTPKGLALPRTVGDYELLEEIARGGMGVVFRARQRSLNRVVAIKMVLNGSFASVDALQRFKMEARAAAALDHPNIVPVFEFGQLEGHPYFAMPLVEGTNLGELVAKHGPRRPDDAISLMLPVIEAVEYAHQTGIIHRDLKPENILLDRMGRPRITDFGIAKQAGTDSGTLHGQVLGTPGYMAPEQARGNIQRIGPATDIYALGGILYFLLTGKPPFADESVTEILFMVERVPVVAPRAYVADLPPALEAVVLNCLHKDPADRYSSAAALAKALSLVTREPTVNLEAVRPKTEMLLSALRNSPEPNPPAVSAAAMPGTLDARVLTPPPDQRTLPEPVPRRRRSAAVGTVAAIAVLAGIAIWRMPSWLRGPEPSPAPRQNQREEPEPRVVVENPLVLPEPTRNECGLKVQILGAPVADGVVPVFLGEKVALKVEVERDAWVGIWSIDAKGTVVQLFPNKVDTDNRVLAGKPRLVPPDDMYTIDGDTETPPNAVEQLRVLASTARWDPIEGENQAGLFAIFQSIAARKAAFGQLRGLAVRGRPGVFVSEAALKYRVVPKRP